MEKTWVFVLTRWFVLSVFKLYFRIEYRGAEHVPLQGPVILAPNHVSFLDPLWVSASIKRPLRYMTWDKMFKVPLLGPLMTAYGAFPVNLEKGDRSALKHSLQHLRNGGGLVIFPEGGRTRTGELMPFKQGVISLALNTNVPVVPVTIIGGYRAFSPHMRFPLPLKLKVVYHPPVALQLPAETTVPKDCQKDWMQMQADLLNRQVASVLPPDALPKTALQS